MLESNYLVTLSGLTNSSAYHTFLLDEERGRLFVGAKDYIFSFDLVDITMNNQSVNIKMLIYIEKGRRRGEH